jgi:hypothetical protein
LVGWEGSEVDASRGDWRGLTTGSGAAVSTTLVGVGADAVKAGDAIDVGVNVDNGISIVGEGIASFP